MLFVMVPAGSHTGADQQQAASPPIRYKIEPLEKILAGRKERREQFTSSQIQLLEKLNRADVDHLAQLTQLVVPEVWVSDERSYSPLPATYGWAAPYAKALIVHQPGQVFGGYENGNLVRWGPMSSGRKTHPTPSGLFHLNWRSKGRYSTVDPSWYMSWYFNFHNRLGLSFHEYTLPGYPASHACIRLLKRDAQWLYGWGEGTTPTTAGTPVLILGQYDFDAPPPWHSLSWLATGISLPAGPSLQSPPLGQSGAADVSFPPTRLLARPGFHQQTQSASAPQSGVVHRPDLFHCGGEE